MEDPFESLRDFPWDISPEDHTPFTRIPWAKPPWSEEQHAAHKERMIGNNYSKGKPVSQETRDKISVGNKGKIRTPEQKAAQSNMRIGKNRIPDHLASKNTLNNRRWRAKRRLAQDTTD